jgi:hypothetical protein
MPVQYTYPEFEKALNTFAHNVEERMKDRLDGTRLQSKITVTPATYSMNNNLISMNLKMPAYAHWADTGRGPGKMPPPLPILDWMIYHAIPLSALYPIRLKIANEGTEGRHFISLFTQYAQNFFNLLNKAIVADIAQNLTMTFNTNGIPAKTIS